MKEIEGFESLRQRYLNGNRRVKGEVLNGLCALHGYSRKGAIRLLNAEVNRLCEGRPKPQRKRGRKPRYLGDAAFEAVLKGLWSETDYMCSTNLVKARTEWLPAYEEMYGTIRADVRGKVLTVSSATVDRILKPYKFRGRGRCGTKPGDLLREQIQISTSVWEEAEPGFVEGDTVAHCGGSLAGEFVWSLTATDICTTWTELRATWHKGHAAVVEQLRDIRESLPFPLRVWNSDCGGEFINHAMIKYLSETNAQFLRSRPYKKNDNAHVEQKNYTHARQLLGYQRIDNHNLVDPLNQLLKAFSMLRNHFYPTRKLKSKTVIGGKTIKLFDEPKTPYERVLAHPSISESIKESLRQLHSTLNPVRLRKQIRATSRQLLRHASVTSILIDRPDLSGNIQL